MPRNYIFILLPMLVLLLPIWAKAQNFKGRVILGINASQVEYDALRGYNLPGLVGGIGASFPLDEHWSLEPEILYSQKGSRSSQEEIALRGRQEVIALSYLDLPIIVNYKLSDDLVLQGGLSPNVLLDAQIDDGTGRGFYNARSTFNDYDLTLCLGAEYLAFERLGLNVRWSYSALPFNKVQDTSNLNTVNNPLIGYTGTFNNVLSFSLRYYVNL